MIKRILTAAAVLLLIPLFNIRACANTEYYDAQKYYDEQFEASGASELSEYLDNNTKEYLEKLGCSEAEYEGVTSFSLEAVFDVLLKMLRANVDAPLKGCLTACGAVMLVSVCAGFFPDDEKTKGVLNLICGSFVLISVFIPASGALRSGVSALKLCAGFEKALIPVLAAVLTASGSPGTALSYQGAAFAAAQTVETLAENTALPLVFITGIIGSVGAFLPTLKLSAVSDLLRKTTQTVIGIVASLFTGFIAIKNIIAGSADGLAAKGIKLVTSTFIPVVGGALNEVYSALAGSLSLLKSVVGIYGILAVAAMIIPSVICLALWVLAMRAAGTVSELLGNSQCSEILKNISYMFSMLNVMLIFSAAVFVLSSGMVAGLKTGG